MDQLWTKIGNPLAIFVISILLILCLSNVSNRLNRGTKEAQLSAQQKRSTGECFLEEHCFRLWSRYGLKQLIPWYFVGLSLFY